MFAYLEGEFYVFGGVTKSKQISKLVGCSLQRVGEMESWLVNGACANVADQEIYLCFSVASNELLQDDWRVCRIGTDSLGPFEKIKKAISDMIRRGLQQVKVSFLFGSKL